MERDEEIKDCCLLEGGRWRKDGVVGEEMKGGRRRGGLPQDFSMRA